MALLTTTGLYKDAEGEGYALGAYDTCGGQIDIIEAIFQAAEEMNSLFCATITGLNTISQLIK